MRNFGMVLAAVMVLSGCKNELATVVPPTCLQEIFPGEETFTEYVLYGSRGMPSTEITSRQSYVVPRSAWAFEADRKHPREAGEGLLIALPGNKKEVSAYCVGGGHLTREERKITSSLRRSHRSSR